MKQMSNPPFWGVFREGFRTLFFYFAARKPIFFTQKNGAWFYSAKKDNKLSFSKGLLCIATKVPFLENIKSMLESFQNCMFDDMFASLSQDEKCNLPVGRVNSESWVLVQTANKLSNEFLIWKILHHIWKCSSNKPPINLQGSHNVKRGL